MRIITLLGVIVLALALIFHFAPIGGGNIVPVMTLLGSLLIGLGVLLNQ